MGKVVKVVIAGGGIGGLATGVALRQAGVEAVVWEKAPTLREIGAGITLWPNAMRALGRIGLADAVVAAGREIERGEIRTRTGRVLTASPTGEMGRNLGASTVAIHRADLHRILYAALPPEGVRVGTAVEGWERTGQTVSVRPTHGEPEEAAALVGADGIHSRVRTLLLDDGPPRYSGYTGWRGIASFNHSTVAEGGTSESWGRGARFGIVPIGGGRVYWFCTANVAAGERDGAAGRGRDVLDRFAGWHAPIRELVEATPEDAILRNDIVDRPPSPIWGRGRVTPLGDAAHPMTPNLGQGACQAIEDALALAAHLGRRGDVIAALRAYEAERRRRTAPIVVQSFRLGRVGQLQHPLAVAFRDALVRATPPSVAHRRLEAVFGSAEG